MSHSFTGLPALPLSPITAVGICEKGKKAGHTALTKCSDDLLAGAVTWVTSVGVNSATCVCVHAQETHCACNLTRG